MNDANLHAELLVKVLRQVLRGVNAAVLSARASETEHQARETSLDVTAHVDVGQLVDAIKESKYLAVVFKETDDGFVEACQFLVRFVTSGVVGSAAVKHVAAAVAALVFRYALVERKAVNAHHERPFVVILGERCRPVRRMADVHLAVSSPEAVGPAQRGFFNPGELRQFSQAAQHVHQVRISEDVELQQFAKVLHRRRNAVDKMLLPLEVSTETVSSEHLQRAEQHDQ